MASITYEGSGYTVTVTTTQCFSAATCRMLARQGQPVTLAQGRRVWFSGHATGTNRTALSWRSGMKLIRLKTNLPLRWAERVAEHVEMVR